MKYRVVCRKISDPGGSPLQWNDTIIKNLTLHWETLIQNTGFNMKQLRNSTVLIHPNLVRPHKNRPASFTDPRVIISLAAFLREYGASQVEVGENPGFQYFAREAFKECNLLEPLKKLGVKARFLDDEEWVDVDNPRGRLYRNVKFSKALLDADVLINVPKMKTHMLTGVSLCIKNMLGAIHDDQRQIFHRNDIADKVVDLNFVRSPDLNIIDGLWAMEGQAPFDGDAVEQFNYLLAGREAAAVDAAACLLMGFRVEEIPHVQLGVKRLLPEWNGIDSLEIVGDRLSANTRWFKRAVLSSMGQFPGINCIECGVCRGCLSAVRHSLDWLVASGEIENLEPFTIVSGRAMPNMKSLDTWDGKLILFGNCASEFLSYEPHRRQEPIWIPGCAPHVLDLANFLRTKLHSETK